MIRTTEGTETVPWSTVQKSAREAIAEVPVSYTGAAVLQDYKRLLQILETYDTTVPMPVRVADLHEQFPHLAIGYSYLFNVAVRREPIPYHLIEGVMQAIDAQKQGRISQPKARGLVMDMAETLRRQRQCLSNAESTDVKK